MEQSVELSPLKHPQHDELLKLTLAPPPPATPGVQAVLTPYESLTQYRTAAPFVLSIIALLWMGRHREVVFSKTAR
jgi:hypothetical protein